MRAPGQGASATAFEGCSAQVAALKRAEAKSRGATEPCFGIARAGKNDCKTHAHVCAGGPGVLATLLPSSTSLPAPASESSVANSGSLKTNI
jgi:hypothetical protein